MVGIQSEGQGSWQNLRARSFIHAQDPSMFVRQHIGPLLYKGTQPGGRIEARRREFTFDDEQAFWQASRNLPLQHVLLERLELVNWFPRSPGVYWSDHGQRARRAVFDEERIDNAPGLGDYYRPLAKSALVEEGGIGTIKLRARRIDGIDCWLATAASGRQCAGGIPLVLPHDLFHDAGVSWGDVVQIRGQVRYLQDAKLDDIASAVRNAAPMIVFVNEIVGVSHRRWDAPMIVTPVVLFDIASDETGRRSKYIQYNYTFVQCSAESASDICTAGDWMDRYATFHSGRVVTNFDETYPTLADAPLSFQRLIARTYDRTIIENLNLNGDLITSRIDQIGATMTTEVNLGNGNTFHGDVVVANSIKDSFNRVQAVSGSSDVKQLLEQLSSQVGVALKDMPPEVAQKAADDLETLTKELARPAPRKQWWELSISGIQDAAKAIKGAGTPIIETVTMLLPLLAGIGSPS